MIPPIRSMGFSLTSEVGADDTLIGVRVVPAGRDGNTVLGRTLGLDEIDSGEAITVRPGETFHFPPGSVQVFLRDIDNCNKVGSDGYAAIANTIWTWVQVGNPPDPALFRSLFATARRLDTSHALCAAAMAALAGTDDGFIQVRARIFESLGHAELMCVALNRAIDMYGRISSEFGIQAVEPGAVSTIRPALREIRNAFEHIDDRAIGRVRGAQHPDALSIFDQRDYLSNGVLRYAAYSLDVRAQVIPALVECRQALFNVAAKTAGSAKVLNGPITFFGTTSRQESAVPAE